MIEVGIRFYRRDEVKPGSNIKIMLAILDNGRTMILSGESDFPGRYLDKDSDRIYKILYWADVTNLRVMLDGRYLQCDNGVGIELASNLEIRGISSEEDFRLTQLMRNRDPRTGFPIMDSPEVKHDH